MSRAAGRPVHYQTVTKINEQSYKQDSYRDNNEHSCTAMYTGHPVRTVEYTAKNSVIVLACDNCHIDQNNYLLKDIIQFTSRKLISAYTIFIVISDDITIGFHTNLIQNV